MCELIVPVILAGGQGTRLWPMSRGARPKQFLNLTRPTTMFQQTLQRVSDATTYAPAIVITDSEYRFIVAEQASELGAPLAGVLLEPVARNTAVAIAAAVVYARDRFGPETVLHILSSDQDVVVDAGYLLESLAPQTPAAAKGAVAKAEIHLDFVLLDESSFAAAPNISVDYAIFEKTKHASLVAADFAWSDLGTWDAVWKAGAHDGDHKVTKGPTTLSNFSNSLVVSDHAHMAVDGVDDIAVIATSDAIFVGKLSDAQKVSAMVKMLQQAWTRPSSPKSTRPPIVPGVAIPRCWPATVSKSCACS